MHEYASDADLRRRHTQWHAHEGSTHVWDQPPSGLNYADFTAEALARMVMKGDPESVRAAADQWGTVRQLTVMISRVVESLRESSATALGPRDLLLADADLLTRPSP